MFLSAKLPNRFQRNFILETMLTVSRILCILCMKLKPNWLS